MIDLIIPCYNPAANWQRHLVKLAHQFITQELGGHYEWLKLIIVNDGSTLHFDRPELLELAGSGLNVIILHNSENRGKGYSVRRALNYSRASFCIFTDADIPFGLNGLARVFRRLVDGADVAIGVRTGSNYFQRASFSRRQVSKILLFINRTVFRLPVPDSQTGLKGFNHRGRSLLQKTTINRFLFDLEFMVMASSVHGLNISAVEVGPVEDLSLTGLSARTLLQESVNLFKIFGKKRHERTQKKSFAWH